LALASFFAVVLHGTDYGILTNADASFASIYLSAGIAIVTKFAIAFNRVSAESGIRITRAGKVALCRDRVTNSIAAKIDREFQLVREIESTIVRN